MTHSEAPELREMDDPEGMAIHNATQAIMAQRLDEIERALKFSPDRSYRRELVREYLRLTEPEPKELDL